MSAQNPRRPQQDVSEDGRIKRHFQHYCYCIHRHRWIYTVEYQCGDQIAVCEACYEIHGDKCPFHELGRQRQSSDSGPSELKLPPCPGCNKHVPTKDYSEFQCGTHPLCEDCINKPTCSAHPLAKRRYVGE